MAMWQAIDSFNLSTVEREWLGHQLSLTQKLQQTAKTLVTVELLSAGQQLALADEQGLVTTTDTGHLYAREVILSVASKPLVKARTLCSLTDLHGELAWLDSLGTLVLGESLFSDNAWARGAFQICRADIGPCFLTEDYAHPKEKLLTRRSQFSRNEAVLLLKEAFLPAFWETVIR